MTVDAGSQPISEEKIEKPSEEPETATEEAVGSSSNDDAKIQSEDVSKTIETETEIGDDTQKEEMTSSSQALADGDGSEVLETVTEELSKSVEVDQNEDTSPT